MFTLEALQFLLFLTPGLLVAGILDALVVRREKKDLGIVIEALVFSLLIYTLHSLVSGASPIVLSEAEGVVAYAFDGGSLVASWA